MVFIGNSVSRSMSREDGWEKVIISSGLMLRPLTTSVTTSWSMSYSGLKLASFSMRESRLTDIFKNLRSEEFKEQTNLINNTVRNNLPLIYSEITDKGAKVYLEQIMKAE